MITLKIPIISILKFLFRLFQFLSTLMCTGFLFSFFFMTTEGKILLIEKTNWDVVMVITLGLMITYSDWFIMMLFDERLF